MANKQNKTYSDPKKFLKTATVEHNKLIDYRGCYVSITKGDFKSDKDSSKSVIRISDKAFHEKTKTLGFGEDKWIENLELPDGITTISKGMFENCNHLKSITLPDSVRHIGENAFKGCSNLESIKVSIDFISDNPAANQTINFGAEAFEGCTSLASFELAFKSDEIKSLKGIQKKIAVNKIFGLRSAYFGGEYPLSKLPGLSAEQSKIVFKNLLGNFNSLLKKYLNFLNPASRQIIQVVSSGSYYDLKQFVFDTILLLPDGETSPKMFVVGQPSTDSVLKKGMLANGTWTKHPRGDFYYNCNLFSSDKTLDEYYLDEKYREFYYYASSLGAKYISINLIDTHYSGKGKEATSNNDANLNANVGSLADIHAGLDKETKDLEKIVSKITNSWSREYISSSSAKFDYKNGVWSKVEWNGMTQTLLNKTGQRWEDEDNYTSYFSSNQLSSKKIDSELKIALNIEQIPDVKGEVSFDFLKKDLAWAKFWQDHKLKLIVEQDGYNPSPETKSDDPDEKKKNELPESQGASKSLKYSDWGKNLFERPDDTKELLDVVNNNKFVNLVAMGGSGKTSLVKLFMAEYETSFDRIEYSLINNNLSSDIFGNNSTLKEAFDKEKSLKKIDDSYDRFQKALEILHSCDTENNLWIIDINETSNYEEIEEIIETWIVETNQIVSPWKKWRFLFVGRKCFHSIETNLFVPYDLKNTKEVLTGIFFNYLGVRKDGYQHKVGEGKINLEELFLGLFELPILVEHTAKFLSKLPVCDSTDAIFKWIDPKGRNKKASNKFLTKLKAQGPAFWNKNQDFTKAPQYKNVADFLKCLLFFDDLKEDQKYVCRHFMLWSAVPLTLEEICLLIGDNKDYSEFELGICLNELEEERIIIGDNKDGEMAYKMHALTADAFRVQVLQEKKVDDKYRDFSNYFQNVRSLEDTSNDVNNCLSFCFAETKKTSETYLPSEFFDNNPDIFNADFFNFLSILVVESSVYEKWYKLKLIEDDGLWNIKKHADKFNKYLEYKDKSSHLVYVECPTKAIEKKDDPIIHRLINNMVKVDDKFAINKYAVSNIEWESIMEYSTRCDESNTDNQPLVEVNWYDCMDFIIELNKRTNLNFRLPTSKEWTKAYEFSNSNRFDKLQEKDEKTFLTKIISFAWFDENSEGKTHPVNETISPIENDHGIKNMLGNVWEWCEDLDAEWGVPERVCRGGSWAVLATDCFVAHYATNSPDYMDNEIGFRLALSLPSQE